MVDVIMVVNIFLSAETDVFIGILVANMVFQQRAQNCVFLKYGILNCKFIKAFFC